MTFVRHFHSEHWLYPGLVLLCFSGCQGTNSSGAPVVFTASPNSCNTSMDSSKCDSVQLSLIGTNFWGGTRVTLTGASGNYTCTAHDVTNSSMRASCETASAVTGNYFLTATNDPGLASILTPFTISSGTAAPSLTSISTSSCNTNLGNCGEITLTATGSGFAPGAVATFWGGNTAYNCSTSSVTSTLMTFVCASQTETVGNYSIYITNPGSLPSNSEAFNINSVGSTSAASMDSVNLASCNPEKDSSGCTAISLLISGSNIQSGAQISMTGPLTYNCLTSSTSSTTLSAICFAPTAAAGNYTLSVTNPSATSSSTASFFIGADAQSSQ